MFASCTSSVHSVKHRALPFWQTSLRLRLAAIVFPQGCPLSRQRELSPTRLISQGRSWLSWWPCADPVCSVSFSLEQYSRCCPLSDEQKGTVPSLDLLAMVLLPQLDMLLVFMATRDTPVAHVQPLSPGPSELSRGFGSLLDNILPLSFPLSQGSSVFSPAAYLGYGEEQTFSQTYWPALQCLKPWQDHTVFSSSRSYWNCLGFHIYMNGKWSKLSFIFSMSWDTIFLLKM